MDKEGESDWKHFQPDVRHANGTSAICEMPRDLQCRGCDDNIFDSSEDELRNHKPRTTTTQSYINSPTAPTARHGNERLRDVSNSRRATGNTISLSLTPRSIGTREAQEHLDKVTKQNFDLKLEVYHRREKVDDLEKKLVRLQQLEEDNEELVGYNDELLAELEKRDRALDEAVAMICDLEDEKKELKRQWHGFKNLVEGHQKAITGASGHGTDACIPPALQHSRTPSLEQDESFRQDALPSFLHGPAPSTNTLCSMYVNDSELIRSLSSSFSLGSSHSHGEGLGYEKVTHSPQLSDLSNGDLDEVCMRNNLSPTENSPAGRSENTSEMQFEGSEPSRERRLSRINAWIADRAISVSPPKSRVKRMKDTSAGGTFQSLSSVLHQLSLADHRTSQPMPRKKKASDLRATAESIEDHPAPLQDVLPPIPGTITRRIRETSDSDTRRQVDNSRVREPVERTSPSHAFVSPPSRSYKGASQLGKNSAYSKNDLRAPRYEEYQSGLSAVRRSPTTERESSASCQVMGDKLANTQSSTTVPSQRRDEKVSQEQARSFSRPFSSMETKATSQSPELASTVIAPGHQARPMLTPRTSSSQPWCPSSAKQFSTMQTQDFTLERDANSDHSLQRVAGLRQRVKHFVRHNSFSNKSGANDQASSHSAPKRSSSITQRLRGFNQRGGNVLVDEEGAGADHRQTSTSSALNRSLLSSASTSTSTSTGFVKVSTPNGKSLAGERMVVQLH